MTKQILYALDFDGVICDSAVETGISGWKAARQLYPGLPALDMPTEQALEQFRRFRPLLETGYESIIFMRLLHDGIQLEALLNDFSALKQQFLVNSVQDVEELKQVFGATRDAWITEQPEQWIAMNPLFPGVAEKLQQLQMQDCWYIVTTKQERFVKQILAANAIDIPEQNIFGLERKLSKQAVLLQLLQRYQQRQIVFVEDRLPTLQGIVKNHELHEVRLQLADWGYNTEDDRLSVDVSPIELIELNQFLM